MNRAVSPTFNCTTTDKTLWLVQDTLDAVGHTHWKQLLFIMCYMHSVVKERRKFGPIGWNIAYEFNQPDMTASLHFLQVGTSSFQRW